MPLQTSFHKFILLGLMLVTLGCQSGRKMSDTVSIEKSVVLNSSKEKVWKALTDEKELGQWWNKGVRLEPRLDGDFYEPWGKGNLATGKVIEVENQKMIQFTWREKAWKANQETICQFSLEEKDNKTHFTVTHSGWEQFENQKQLIESFEMGWSGIFKLLEKHLSK